VAISVLRGVPVKRDFEYLQFGHRLPLSQRLAQKSSGRPACHLV
jgi:hypothetical protein